MSRRRSVVDMATGPTGPTNSITLSMSPDPLPSSARHSTSVGEPRGIKRRRNRDAFDDGLFYDALGFDGTDEREIESIDLTGAGSSSEVAKTAAKQTEDAIKAQQPKDDDKSHSILSAYRCPICMDPPENATTTACGHLFCHACIIECLNRSGDQSDNTNKSRGTCPVCRKTLSRVEVPGPRRGLVPLRFKVMTKERAGPSNA